MSLLLKLKSAVEVDPALKDRELREEYFNTQILPLMENVSLFMKLGQEVAAKECGKLDEAMNYRKGPEGVAGKDLIGTTGGAVDVDKDRFHGPNYLGANISLFVPSESGAFRAEHFHVRIKERNNRVPGTESWNETPVARVSFSTNRLDGEERDCKNIEEIQAAFLKHMTSIHTPQAILEINRQAVAQAEAQKAKAFEWQDYSI